MTDPTEVALGDDEVSDALANHIGVYESQDHDGGCATEFVWR